MKNKIGQPVKREAATGVEAPTIQPVKFSSGYTAALLVNSFRFSQGSARFQEKEILLYLATEYRDQLDPKVVKRSIKKAARIASGIRHNPKTHKRMARDSIMISDRKRKREDRATVRGFAYNLIDHLDTAPNINRTNLNIGSLAVSTINRDYRHLRLGKNSAGREREAVAKMTPYNDPFLSFWVYYGLLSESTGMPEYNAMFDAMVTDFDEAQGYNEDCQSKAAALLDFHVQHHPEHAGRLSLL